MKKTYLIPSVVAIVVGVAAFFGGLTYQKHKDSLSGVAPQDLSAKLQTLGLAAGNGGGFAGRTGGRRGGPGGALSGEIISKDDQSITIKLRDGSTKVAYISSATTVFATTSATTRDLMVGKQVSALGTPNSDGSIAALNVQIRPLTSPATSQQ